MFWIDLCDFGVPYFCFLEEFQLGKYLGDEEKNESSVLLAKTLMELFLENLLYV